MNKLVACTTDRKGDTHNIMETKVAFSFFSLSLSPLSLDIIRDIFLYYYYYLFFLCCCEMIHGFEIYKNIL